MRAPQAPWTLAHSAGSLPLVAVGPREARWTFGVLDDTGDPAVLCPRHQGRVVTVVRAEERPVRIGPRGIHAQSPAGKMPVEVLEERRTSGPWAS